MKKNILIISALFFCFLLTGNFSFGQVKLPALVRDSMIIQRNTKLKIWGWAHPGEKVNVKFMGKSHKTTTGKDGKWLVWLPPMKAGGPYTMEITGRNKIKLNNILVGDVWLCAGQSNMVHNMWTHRERYGKDIAEANYPEIRQYLVPTTADLVGPEADMPLAFWKSANPTDVKKFAVVAYFFAKKLYDKYHIPVGIINASVGGTPIEAWMSEEGLKEFPDILKTVEENKDTANVNSINRTARTEMGKSYRERAENDEGLTGPVTWFDTAYVPKGWHTINIPGYWEDQGVKNLDGIVWYRREIEIPASMTGIPAKIALGRIVDADKLYINGVLVGNTTYQYPQRWYTAPAGVLKPGKNLFVIQVTNNFGKGGFVTDKPYFVSAAGQTVDLKGYWQYKVGEVFSHDRGFVRSINVQYQPTALFNAMVAPMTNYAIKGIVWYQGESNAGNPEQYKKLVPAFISDWRNQWGEGDIPVLLVQLPNFMDVDYTPPAQSNWALIREDQLDALKIPNTGMVVTIDLGEWNDIHPDRKKPVGERLALAAEKIAYGEQNIVYSGPIFKSAQIEGNKIIISFDHVGGGLVTRDGGPPEHFAIAGADKKFKWGKAIIKDNKVVVWNDDVPDPKYVRYAWADNPEFANLYNKEGLPASPFRTDK